jgi:transporter family protein
MWKWYAVLSAVFAALTAVFAKTGVKNIDSNLATAIRTCVIIIITWGIVIASNSFGEIKNLTKQNWTFLILSGIATGLSWLFYFKALQTGNASKVAPIDKLSVVFTILLSFLILKEPFSLKVLVGGLFIAAGSLIILTAK